MSPTNERDAGFCSGGSENEEDLEHHHQIRLINNGSECSQDAQSSEDSSLGEKFVLPLTPVSVPAKNKRKSSEPIRVVVTALGQSGPIKKRIKLENEKMLARQEDEEELQLKQELTLTTSTTAPLLSPDPFRPWAASLLGENKPIVHAYPLSPAHSFKRHPGVTTLHRIPAEERSVQPHFLQPVQEEPIALVAKRTKSPCPVPVKMVDGHSAIRSLFAQQQKVTEDPRPAHMNSTPPSLVDETSSTASSLTVAPPPGTLNLSVKAPPHSHSEDSSPQDGEKKGSSINGKDATQRNYKNMTRERRIEANARERTRVHTISAAFEKLRHSVPAYSNTQKLSKLSVLRIACSYIMSLSRIAGMDYSEDQSEPAIGDCVDALTKTIQTEGKLRKKKDE